MCRWCSFFFLNAMVSNNMGTGGYHKDAEKKHSDVQYDISFGRMLYRSFYLCYYPQRVWFRENLYIVDYHY